MLPVTETYTRGTTAVHSQRSCTVTPDQNQAQAVTQVEAGRAREDEPSGAAVRDQGAAHTLAVFNIKKVLLRGEDRLDLFSCHYCHERQVEERGSEGEQVEDKEEEQL